MKINEKLIKQLSERLKTGIRETRHLIELLCIFIVVIALEYYSILNPSLTTFILTSILFIWSARYGLISFLLSLSFFELTFMFYISKKL